MCRVKYSECYELSTKDRKGKILGEKMSFENSKQMAQKLQDIARTADEEISYVDIYMPVPVLQVDILKAFDLYVNDNHYIKLVFFTTRHNDKRDQSYLILPYKSNVLRIA